MKQSLRCFSLESRRTWRWGPSSSIASEVASPLRCGPFPSAESDDTRNSNNKDLALATRLLCTASHLIVLFHFVCCGGGCLRQKCFTCNPISKLVAKDNSYTTHMSDWASGLSMQSFEGHDLEYGSKPKKAATSPWKRVLWCLPLDPHSSSCAFFRDAFCQSAVATGEAMVATEMIAALTLQWTSISLGQVHSKQNKYQWPL